MAAFAQPKIEDPHTRTQELNEPMFLPTMAQISGTVAGPKPKTSVRSIPLGPAGSVAGSMPKRIHTLDRRGAKELLADGYFGIGLIGMHDEAFVIKPPVCPDDASFATRIRELAVRVKAASTRNVAAGLSLGLDILGRAPRGRTGIVIVTSGAPTLKLAWVQELVEEAITRRTGVHLILLGSDEQDEEALAGLTTKSALGYGSLSVANSTGELLDCLRMALDGLLPAAGMRGTNTALILTDCTERMGEPFAGTTRVAMLSGALAEFLSDPLAQPIQKRLAA